MFNNLDSNNIERGWIALEARVAALAEIQFSTMPAQMFKGGDYTYFQTSMFEADTPVTVRKQIWEAYDGIIERFIQKWKELYPDRQWSDELGIDWKIYGGFLNKKEPEEKKIASNLSFKDQISGGVTYKAGEFFTWPNSEKAKYWSTNPDQREMFIKKWKETYPDQRWDDNVIGIEWNVYGGYLITSKGE